MKISIFGLGYVGSVSAGCLAKSGHSVVGVDAQPTKVEMINAGRSPIIEAEIGELLAEAASNGSLRATTSAAEAVRESDLSLICVGTPSAPNGSLSTKYVREVCTEIGEALRTKSEFHVVVIRSTILPGTMRGLVQPTLEEASGKRAGRDFGLCNNPEFLREGTAVRDFWEPPKTVIGEIDARSGEALASLYADLEAPLIRTSLETAEMVKYADNAWHALKIGFANEIGGLCKALAIDSWKVMDIFCQDQKLNLSSAYLRPGFAFGGSCLPKDLRALTYCGRQQDRDMPILRAVLESNQQVIERGLQLVLDKQHRRVGVLGFSFKPGTDDLRESPVVELIERLIGKGFDLKLYDRNVNIARLVGANRDFILNHIPHISKLMVESVDEVLQHAETVVIGNGDPEFRGVPEKLGDDQMLVDLVRVADKTSDGKHYDGICW